MGRDPGQHEKLLGVKLNVLVRGQWPDAAPGDLGTLPGAVTLAEGRAGRGWVLSDDPAAESLGAALVWAQSHEVGELHLVVDPSIGPVMARRAGAFRDAPTVWTASGRDLVRVAPAPAVDPAGATALSSVAALWGDLLVLHGVEPVVEHGVLRGDVLGLEVARLVGDDEHGWTLAIGIGDHDREARQEMRPGEDPEAALDQVVELVRMWRSPAARLHPANTLAPERWLRAIVVSRPDLAGAVKLEPLAPPVERTDLRLRSPAPAAGTDVDGRPVVVVCSTGIDIDLVPSAADSRVLYGADSRLVLVVPAGDDHPATRRLAASLVEPAEVVTLGRDWPALTWSPASVE